MTRFVVAVLFLPFIAISGVPAQEQLLKIVCLDPFQVKIASEACEVYCSNCHKPELLARKWFFTRATGDDAVDALKTFLGSHGSCPHNHHELLAKRLAEQAGSN